MTNVILHALINASQDQQLFAEKAIDQLIQIINESNFLYKVRTASYSRRIFQLDDGSVIEATNETIEKLITSGKEFKTQPDGVIDLNVKLKFLRRGIVGFVNPPNPLITTSTRFYNPWMRTDDFLSLAAQWMHEWLHVSGFKHASQTPDRNDVNYTIGRLVIESGKEIMRAKKIDEELIQNAGKGFLYPDEKIINSIEEIKLDHK